MQTLFRRAAALVLTAVLLLGAADGRAFTGLSDWAAKEVILAAQSGLAFPAMEERDLSLPITRLEFCHLAVNLYLGVQERDPVLTYAQPFSDCDDPCALYAAHLGIVNGVDGERFLPDAPVKKQDAAVMLTRVLALRGMSLSFGRIGQFADHQQIDAYAANAVYFLRANGVYKGDLQNRAAPQSGIPTQEAVIMALRTLQYYWQDQPIAPTPAQPEAKVKVKDAELYLGMPEEELYALFGEPTASLRSGTRFVWQVYALDDYQTFFMAGTDQGRIAALYALGDAFSIEGASAGAKQPSAPGTGYAGAQVQFFTDQPGSSRLYAVQVTANEYAALRSVFWGEDYALISFHLTNAFRTHHGFTPLTWSDEAAAAARAKCIDMGLNDYFGHTDSQGRDGGSLLTAQGIAWSSCGENIGAGQIDGIAVFDDWVNSRSHRSLLLNTSVSHLGVGAQLVEGSRYARYFAQEFFAPKG